MALAIVLFFIAARVAVGGAVGVVSFREPIRAVLSLVVVMLALSILFLLLSAQFVFVVQIIVYAGAVMVLFLFVIALLGPARESGRRRLLFQAGLSGLFVLASFRLLYPLLHAPHYPPPETPHLSTFSP